MLEDYKSFYLFPLTNINLFPHTTKPLNIFEPKYIEMVNKSIQENTPIAIGFLAEGEALVRPIAGFAKAQIINKRLDGSLLIFMSGIGKVQLNFNSIQVRGELTKLNGEVIVQHTVLEDSLKSKYNALGEILAKWILTHITDRIQSETFMKQLIGPKEVISAFSAYLIYDYDLQYEMMEIHSLTEQIKFLYRLLESGKLTKA